jgi:Methyltransferase domain
MRMLMTISSGADSENLSLIEYLNRHLQLISQSREEEFPARHEAFVAGLQSYSEQQPGASDIAHYSTAFSAFQRRYLAFKERLATEDLSQVLAASSSRIGDRLTDRFAKDSYQRVKELLVLADLRDCRRLVMVGCGAFPATLLWFSDQLPAIDYIGLDIDPDCVLLANRMAEALGRRNLRFETVDGSDFNYSGADFVYIANQVAPKRKVLEQLLQYATPQLQVAVREPSHLGELLAAPVRRDLPPGFAICASGPVSPAFLSYDLLLRWEGRA